MILSQNGVHIHIYIHILYALVYHGISPKVPGLRPKDWLQTNASNASAGLSAAWRWTRMTTANGAKQYLNNLPTEKNEWAILL